MSRHSFSFKRSAIPRTNIEALERRLLLAADTAPYVTTGQIEFTDLIVGNAVSNHGLLAADLDGDGDLDAVATSNIDHDVYVYENLNDGTFTRHVIEDDLRGAYPALLDDLDEDFVQTGKGYREVLDGDLIACGEDLKRLLRRDIVREGQAPGAIV